MPTVDAGTVASVGGSGRPASAPASGAMDSARVRAAHRRLEIGVRVFMRNSFEAGEVRCIGDQIRTTWSRRRQVVTRESRVSVRCCHSGASSAGVAPRS